MLSSLSADLRLQADAAATAAACSHGATKLASPCSPRSVLPGSTILSHA